MSHGDSVTKLPEGFAVVARTVDTPVAAIADELRNYYGVQFHPEVVHTRGGRQVIANFTLNICGCPQNWTMSRFVEEACQSVKEHVGDKRVLLALSGGVDSSTLAFLLHKAIGETISPACI